MDYIIAANPTNALTSWRPLRTVPVDSWRVSSSAAPGIPPKLAGALVSSCLVSSFRGARLLYKFGGMSIVLITPHFTENPPPAYVVHSSQFTVHSSQSKRGRGSSSQQHKVCVCMCVRVCADTVLPRSPVRNFSQRCLRSPGDTYGTEAAYNRSMD